MKQKRILSILLSFAAIFSSVLGNITFAYDDTTELTYLDCNVSGAYMNMYTQTLTESYTLVTSDMNRLWDDRWYVVKGDVTISQRILLETPNDVHLLLCDNSKLTAEQGIRIPETATLYIYSQSDDPTVMGELYAKGYDNAAGIGGDGSGFYSRLSSGTLIINGGKITAEGGSFAAGIGAASEANNAVYNYSTTINGGIVTAIGGSHAAGIGGGHSSDNREVIINGGTVTARGGYFGAGIGGGAYASGGTITINGGSVNAVAGTNAATIGNGADNGGESIVQNYKKDDLTLKTYILTGAKESQKVASVEGTSSFLSDIFTHYFGINNIYVSEPNMLFFYLPVRNNMSDVNVTRITMTDGQVFEPGSSQETDTVHLNCIHAQTSGDFCVHCRMNTSTGEYGDDESNVYKISTAEDLIAFGEFVNSGSPHIDAVLTDDINITVDSLGSSFQIGNEEIQYAGTFDGQNHTINVSFEDGEHVCTL